MRQCAALTHKNSLILIHIFQRLKIHFIYFSSLKLEDKTLSIDIRQYSLNELPQLLGALQTIIDFYQ
jgi:hypothetical protein